MLASACANESLGARLTWYSYFVFATSLARCFAPAGSVAFKQRRIVARRAWRPYSLRRRDSAKVVPMVEQKMSDCMCSSARMISSSLANGGVKPTAAKWRRIEEALVTNSSTSALTILALFVTLPVIKSGFIARARASTSLDAISG